MVLGALECGPIARPRPQTAVFRGLRMQICAVLPKARPLPSVVNIITLIHRENLDSAISGPKSFGFSSLGEKLRFPRATLIKSNRWATFTQGVTFQKNLWKYGIVAGIVSTVVFTMYTMLGMQLQAQEMVKNDLDIKIKTYEVSML